ncbi:hypothetical protein IE077_001899 [Cardiosporidium cionae]|uniref:CBS domain-containing protein n=1 Tax=Cardiosporidium cionae TaxID=476202 RepID=A0ABQ7JG30_9APIC|nr:hypothetical protein IE077_001899 [Cardiosporidium cionae]|eukprot:KAF8822942.1 hypothetical protein IE077_001899 [Cardiosporidium cionae]
MTSMSEISKIDDAAFSPPEGPFLISGAATEDASVKTSSAPDAAFSSPSSMTDSPLILGAAAMSPLLQISMENDVAVPSMISSFSQAGQVNSPMQLQNNIPSNRLVSRENAFFVKDAGSILRHVAHQQHHIDSQKRLLTGISQPHILRKVLVEEEDFEEISDAESISNSGMTPAVRPTEVNGTHTPPEELSVVSANSSMLSSTQSLKLLSPKKQLQWPSKPATPNVDHIGDLEPRMNFGYHSSISDETSGLSKYQLKRATRHLVHSPQYTINTYNQQFYQNKQQDSGSVGSSPLMVPKSFSGLPKGEEDRYGSSLESIDESNISIIRDNGDLNPTKKNNESPNVTIFTTLNNGRGQSFLPKLPLSENDEKRSIDELQIYSINKQKMPSFSERMNTLLFSQIEVVLPLLHEQNTVVIDEDGSIDVFLQLLNQHSLRSCVVQHFKQRWLCKGKISFSFVDVRDFLCHIVAMHEQWKNKTFHQIMEMTKSQKVGKIANISKRTPFVRHDISNTVAQLCAAFKPCCRVPVFDKNKLVRVVSPADLLSILSQNDILLEIENATGMPIKNAAKEQILTIMESESLLKAMILMVRHGYSAIPIVSSRNPSLVLEVITVREIQYVAVAQNEIHSENMINEPALKFVLHLRKNGRLPAEPYALLAENASLSAMINVFLKNMVKNTQAVHRIFLINKDNVMTGMVSLTNVIRNIADFLGDFYKVPRREMLPHSHPAHNRN